MPQREDDRRAMPSTPRSALRHAGSTRLAATRLVREGRDPTPGAPVPFAGIKPVSAKAVGSFVPRLTRPAFERYGFSAATLITDWATIVGPDIARYTAPERLKWPRRVVVADDEAAEAGKGRPGGTLIVAVDPGRALDVQYKAAQIIERINAYFGYRAVSDLRIVQSAAAPGARAPAARPAPPAPPGARVGRASSPARPVDLSGIADDKLRAALERMAAGLVSRKVRAASAA